MTTKPTLAYFDDGQSITLYCKDSRDMCELENESVDLIATDPPYQLSSTSRPRPDQSAKGSYGREVPFSRQQSRIKGFMGQEWDVLPPVEVWRECLRVLKPGAFAFVMTTPRQDSLCQILMDLTNAGFEMNYSSLYWTYASGFPKAQNIGKAVDKKLGVESKVLGQSPNWRESKRNREQFGSMEVRGENAGLITEVVSPQAKALDGSYGGAQFKPAVEVIIVAMKPLSEKTFGDQALKNQKGITWLDDCRIPYETEGDRELSHRNALGPVERYKTHKMIYDGGKRSAGFEDTHNPSGRFPANLLVSDDVLNDGKVSKSSPVGFKGIGWKHSGNTKNEMTPLKYQPDISDSGSFSRYFDLDAWFAERIKQLPESVQRTFPFLIAPKASKSEKNRGIGVAVLRTTHGSTPRKNEAENKSPNYHPTVKPLKLMSYLITLGSRKGDMVLDPFIGTGTTAIACQILGRHCTGYEIKPEYCEIAKRRLSIYRQRVMSL